MTAREQKYTEHLIIRCTPTQKQQLTQIANSYGHTKTQLGRHLIFSNLPNLMRNRFFDYSV